MTEARRTGPALLPDPRKVVARLFLPGQEATTPGPSRASGIVERCMALDEDEVRAAVERMDTEYAGRHRDLPGRLEANFAAVAHRVPDAEDLSPERRRLIGAYFTQEYAIETAALCNPSVVPHPDQDGPDGALRFVMSARAVGEGHISSIVFRSGTLSAGGEVEMDPLSPYVDAGAITAGDIDRERLAREACDAGADPETMDFVLASLPERFPRAVLDSALEDLHSVRTTLMHAEHTAACLRLAADGIYEVDYGVGTDLSERTLMPATAVESNGMEDARFVRFTEDDGTTSYLATYTGFDGSRITSRRLDTQDFTRFDACSLTGAAAVNKGMALFPRRVGGRYFALSRWDRENNTLASSADGFHWDEVQPLQVPRQPWELVQLGNCGSPIETDEGWLVLTHGVGPMRGYSLGVLLLDLDDPSRVLGRLRDPLLTPAPDERDGYVPNVVYSCGGLTHGGHLLVPYGCSDATIRLAVLDLAGLLERLTGPDREAPAP